ncbi:MAG: GNAT family N-acetyltransferase [Gammaproteobacteria bacterium]|nr:GNAT family N-acetyltransferase [Gammaproteobacteria bacterium]MCW5583940.1 GNAT family N-acetyltransferase [Gammaproteobacteria bacterium]
MQNIQIVIDEKPSSENDEILINHLFKYETEELLHDVPKHISIYLKDENQKIVGGVLIWIHTESIYIPTIWVDENLRQHGYGKKLLQIAEEEGRKRGCKYITLDANFQAASFYIKQGYHVIGEIKNYIFNHTKTYFRKSLMLSSTQENNEINFSDIKLVPAPLKDYPTIQNMARFYVYDMSQYLGGEAGWECPEDGLYECIDFKKYWQADDAFPFIIR